MQWLLVLVPEPRPYSLWVSFCSPSHVVPFPAARDLRVPVAAVDGDLNDDSVVVAAAGDVSHELHSVPVAHFGT